MRDAERKQAEKQAKIYLAVLACLLVVAVMVTVFTFYREEVPSAEGETSNTEPIERFSAENEVLIQQEAQPVKQGLNDANSQIEKEETVKVDPSLQEDTTVMEDNEPAPTMSVSVEEVDEGESQLEVAAEPQNMTVAFDPEMDRMVWPVSGAVLMDYSSDTLIYDRTLDLYRTNESLCIGATEAEEVLAAVDGIVTEIGASDALGNFVVLDNGDGCETTYGQLSEDIWVALGEYVEQGEAIGCVDVPSWYSSALGTHLNFTVRVNGETVNPLEFLENVLEDE